MHIPKDIGLWLQETLQDLEKEDAGMIYFVLGDLASVPPYTANRWQLGVDMIYRSVLCGLIAVNDYGVFPDKSSFFDGIRILNPNDASGDGFWHATLVWGTDRLSKLLDAHFPPRGERDDKLNPAFIEALESIFAENAVPWSDKPLLPIMPAAVGATTDAAAR
jgi:hypothetical protein